MIWNDNPFTVLPRKKIEVEVQALSCPLAGANGIKKVSATRTRTYQEMLTFIDSRDVLKSILQ